MSWPYDVSPLTPEEKDLRREALDQYAAIAHYSALAPAALFLLVRLARLAIRLRPGSGDGYGSYQQVPRSPVVKARRLGLPGGLGARWGMLRWWLADDVYLGGVHWGHRDEWILGMGWLAWLLVLCVMGTGKDYFHLTKRFGIVAISQLPIQYLLSLKTLNPFAFIFYSSHEQVNRFHRVLGRVIYTLLLIHMVLYNAFFIYAGIWLSRFFAPIVFAGVAASFAMHALIATATARVRELSYRVFFVTHLVAVTVVPILIFFHAPAARWYLVEGLGVFILDLGTRKATTMTAPSTMETIPGTTLVKVSSSIPAHKAASFRARPGSHIYLSLPPDGRTSAVPGSDSPIFDFLFNPFTVASVDEDNNTITFIARTRTGPMTNVLSQFASAPTPSNPEGRISLALEGPYGALGKSFHDLLGWGASRVLLIAGGVGASFAVPIYHAILQDSPSTKVQLIWAIRGAGDATWAVSDTNPAGKSVLEDEHVELFLTGDMGVADGADNAATGDGIEMSSMRRDRRDRYTAHHARKRPNLEKIVGDTFRQGHEEKVAVIVCGPAEMARETRLHVRPWVMKGRKVWWHDESFGW